MAKLSSHNFWRHFFYHFWLGMGFFGCEKNLVDQAPGWHYIFLGARESPKKTFIATSASSVGGGVDQWFILSITHRDFTKLSEKKRSTIFLAHLPNRGFLILSEIHRFMIRIPNRIKKLGGWSTLFFEKKIVKKIIKNRTREVLKIKNDSESTYLNHVDPSFL